MTPFGSYYERDFSGLMAVLADREMTVKTDRLPMVSGDVVELAGSGARCEGQRVAYRRAQIVVESAPRCVVSRRACTPDHEDQGVKIIVFDVQVCEKIGIPIESPFGVCDRGQVMAWIEVMEGSSGNKPTGAFRARLVELHGRLEAMRESFGINRLERLVEISEANTEAIGKPISDRIHDLLRSNPDMSFSPAEIMECIHASDANVEAIKKALQRLCARNVIERVGHAEYKVNMPPSEGNTP